MPNRYDIAIRSDDEAKQDYILKRLSTIKDMSVAVKNHKGFKQIVAVCESDESAYEQLVCAVAESSVLFEKYKMIVGNIKCLGSPNIDNGCLIGSILSLGYQDELKLAIREFEGSASFCPDTLLTFARPELLEKWKGETDFATRLLADCKTKEDTLDLTLFLLSLDGGKETKVRVSKEYITVNGERKPHLMLCDTPEVNALISTVKEKPISVTIEKTSDFSQGFLDTIRQLGK